MEYEYDVRESFDRWLAGKLPLSAYTDMLNVQEALYGANYNKLRFLENHDQPRIASRVTNEKALVNYTAMLYFLKGTTLLYAGQEYENTHTPSLFERELIDRETGRDLTPLLQKLASLKRSLGDDDAFAASADDENDVAVLLRENRDSRKLGVFSLAARSAEVAAEAPDGDYVNQIDGSPVTVKDGKLHCKGDPIILILPKA